MADERRDGRHGDQGRGGATYTVAATDMGKTIKVRVTFTDGGDTEETLVSEATVAEAPSGALTGFTLVDAGSATDHGALVSKYMGQPGPRLSPLSDVNGPSSNRNSAVCAESVTPSTERGELQYENPQ